MPIVEWDLHKWLLRQTQLIFIRVLESQLLLHTFEKLPIKKIYYQN